ncbi:MAG: DUF4982 domain-containing protein [Clostridiales bacterium]|jgi:beta-galactosidase|nr:DUF4982 domain-containing protein [Clostridiales bacterium]
MKKINFNENWSFCKAGDEGRALSVTLPHDAMLAERRSKDSCGGKGAAWFEGHDYIYEKKFQIPANYRDKKVIFEFEGVYRNAEVFINEKKAAFRPYGYTNFYVDAGEFLHYGGENVMRVRAYNADQPNSRWYSGAGIYRPVSMYVSEKEHIALNGVKIRTLNYNPATIEVRVRTEGKGRVEIEILNAGGEAARAAAESDGEAAATLCIKGARLWAPESPNLYTARVRFKEDAEETVFGIRLVECDAKNGLRINGRRTVLSGACVHHDNGLLGAAAHPFAEFRKIKLLKENGYNAIRSAHNPCSKSTLDACDKLGMLAVDEYADMWYIHKTKYDYAGSFNEWWRRDIADMIDKDYNRPSVIMYSVGNEVSETAQGRGIALAGELAAFCREKDSSRPVTCGINLFFNYLSSLGLGVYSDKKAEATAAKKPRKAVGSEFFNNLAGLLGAKFMKWGASLGGSDRKTKKAFAQFDVAGYNYGEKRYKRDLKKYPGRVILGSETFPFDAYKFIELSKKHPALIGDFVWTGIDYLGETGIGAWEYKNYAPDFSHGPGWLAAGAGRLDLTGKAGGEMAYTRVAYGLDPIRVAVVPVDTARQKHSPASWRMTNAAESWSWNGCDGQKTEVEVYARAYKAGLFINGVCVGKKKLRKDCRAVFRATYRSGAVTAVGFDKGGNEISRIDMKTAGVETKLAVLPEDFAVTPDALCYIRLKYTDGSGAVKPLARGDIRVSVTNGTLLALGNGCPYNARGYLTDTTDTYYGEALAIVKPRTGTITINAESPYGNAAAEIECGGGSAAGEVI